MAAGISADARFAWLQNTYLPNIYQPVTIASLSQGAARDHLENIRKYYVKIFCSEMGWHRILSRFILSPVEDCDGIL